ncbi:MAG: hypothetical protein KDD52_02245, partial [Bdellovibrionales bacterium]|nr:hypothetical protein [Bdellovibrionales bacterium]
YIIDEVHMLSTSAFNALLKTLEEPPAGVFFIFATTEVHKIPETILSRCSRFDFRHISESQIYAYLGQIMQKEKLDVEEQALRMVSRQGNGSLRDALSMLDQVIAFSDGKITGQQVAESLGLTDRTLITQSIESFVSYDVKQALGVLEKVFSKGFDIKSYLLELLEKIRHMILIQNDIGSDLIKAGQEELDWLSAQAEKVASAELERWFDLIKYALGVLGRVEFPRYLLEVTFIRITRKLTSFPLTELLNRLEKLESKLPQGSGQISVQHTQSSQDESSKEHPSQSEKEKPKAGQGPVSWDRLLDQVKKEKPGTAAILVQGKLIGFDESRLSLEYEESSFYYTRASEREFQNYIIATAKTLFGIEPQVEIQARMAKTEKAQKDKEEKKQQQKEALKNPNLEKAVTLFGATVEEVRSLKE